MKKNAIGLSAWQLAMMALGTVIGGSFFLGSSVAIRAAGPSILIGFIFGGILVYFILSALSEMTVAHTDTGSFRTFATRSFGQGAGFVVGWVYWTGMVLAMSSEATAISILLRNWIPNLSIAAFGGAVIIAVTLLNLLGADKLSKLESGLAAIKIFTILSFILVALLLIVGLFPGRAAVGIGELSGETFMPGGFTGLAGSMLIVMFSYAGFEVIGLAASEAREPRKTIPRAIGYTVFSLVGLYVAYIVLLLPLIPTGSLDESISPIVAALNRHGVGWAGTAINIVLITAILSTMLAAMFGLGRMMRSLADDGLAPGWLRDKTDVPYRGILASGVAMLLALGASLLFPRIYLFLISSGGFALLFSYVVIMATYIRFRVKNGRPPADKYGMRGFPYTSLFVLISLIGTIVSMPFVEGQGTGLIAGVVIVLFYTLGYVALRFYRREKNGRLRFMKERARLSAEFSKELAEMNKEEKEE